MVPQKRDWWEEIISREHQYYYVRMYNKIFLDIYLKMKLLFWNLRNNENSKHIADLLLMNDIDIAVFAEYESTEFHYIEKTTNIYSLVNSNYDNKVIAMYKDGITMIPKRDQARYSLYTVTINETVVNVVGVHLQANPYSNSLGRQATLGDLTNDVLELEKTNSDRTVVIGDFNASPFSTEMVSKRGLNAVLFKDIIDRNEQVTFERARYKRFYNPILTSLSESDNTYGSYYYTPGIDSLVWYAYDQVVVRKSLMNRISKVYYCKNIGNTQLLSKAGIPKNSISDHLPLIIEVDL